MFVFLALVTAACTGDSSSPSPSPAGDPTLTRGGTLRVGILNNDVDIWDPQEAPSAHAAFELSRCCLFRTLLSYRAGTTQQEGTELRPDVASALPEISSDGLAWTFHLQEGLHYAPPLQDVEITAPDFVRSLERLLDPTMVGYGWPYFPGLIAPLIDGAQAYADGEASSIAGLEVLDPYTLRIRLSEPNGDLGYLLATWMAAPVPPNPSDPGARLGIAEGHLANFSGFMVASGPYMVEGGQNVDFSLPPVEQVPASGVRGDVVTLVRNPAWDPATDALRPAYVDRIVLSRVSRPELPDGEKADRIAEERGRQAVEAGDLDVLLDVGVPTDTFERFRSDPVLRPRLSFAESDSLHYIGINVAQPPFDDVHVRRALNLAIDKAALIESNAGEGGPLAPQGHIGFNSQEANLLVNYDLAPTPGGKGDPVAARAEMARSRYDRDGDGRCDGSACHGALAVSNPNLAGAELVIEALREIGIRVDLEANDTFYATYQQPSAHVGLRMFDGWVKDYPSAATMFPQLFEGRNVGQCCNDLMVGATASQLKEWGYPAGAVPTVDARIEQCQALLFTAAARCWADLDQTLSEQVVPWVPLWAGVTGRIVSRRVASMVLDQSTPDPQPALDRIALTPEAAAEASPTSPPPPAVAMGEASALDGMYTLRVSAAEVEAAGLKECDAQQALGTYTLTMSRGRWQLSQVLDAPESVWARYNRDYCPNPYPNLYFPGWAGTYRLDGSSLRLRSDDQPLRPGLAWRMRAERDAAGLTLTVTDGPQGWWSSPGFFYRPGTFPWEAGDWTPSG